VILRKDNGMRMKSTIATAMLLGLLPAGPAWAQIADDEQEFQQLAAALKADDAERQDAIATCIAQGRGRSKICSRRGMGCGCSTGSVAASGSRKPVALSWVRRRPSWLRQRQRDLCLPI